MHSSRLLREVMRRNNNTGLFEVLQLEGIQVKSLNEDPLSVSLVEASVAATAPIQLTGMSGGECPLHSSLHKEACDISIEK